MLFRLYVPFLLTTFAYGFVTERPFEVLRDMMKLNKVRSSAEDFNALNDLEGIFQENVMSEDRDSKLIDGNSHIRKKMDFKPKYDPGWKFIGLGKRPRQSQRFAYENPYNSYDPDDSEFYAEDLYHYKDAKANPLLTISTLMNFEVVNAIRDGITEAAKDVKKEDGKHLQHFSEVNNRGNRFSGQSLYVGRQSGVYDPGWMLTGIGK